MGVGKIDFFLRNELDSDSSKRFAFTKDEIADLRERWEQLQDLSMVNLPYLVLFESYLELEKEASAQVLELSTDVSTLLDQFPTSFEIKMNARFVAYLNAAWSFIDQAKIAQGDDIAPNFTCHHQYLAEQNLDFRIMKMLRNAAQHEVIPISSRSISITHNQKVKPSQLNIGLVNYIDRGWIENLSRLNSFDSKTKEQFLQTDFDAIDVIAIVRRHLDQIRELKKLWLSDTSDRSNDALALLQNCIKRLKLNDRDEFSIFDQEGMHVFNSAALSRLTSLQNQSKSKSINPTRSLHTTHDHGQLGSKKVYPPLEQN